MWVGEPDARDDPKGVRARQYGAADLDALTEFADREVACALGVGALSAAAKLGMAQDLDQRLTGVRAAMIAGVLDEAKARLIVRATRVLRTSDAVVVEAQVLPRAAQWSYNRLKSELGRLVIAADPATAAERHERARQRRVVSRQRREDGMGTLTADLSADDLATVWNALDAHARTSRAYTGPGQGDDRTIGQRRADGLVDLCAGYLDDVLAGNLEHRAPRTSTGWTTYRPTQANQPRPSPAGESEARPEPTTTPARKATSDAPTEDAPDLTSEHPDQPASRAETGARPAAPSTELTDQAAPGQQTVAPRAVSEAVLKRLRSTLQRRSMVNVHLGADVVLGHSDNPVYLDGYGWTPAPVGRRVLSQNAQMRRIIDDPITGHALDISAKTYTPSAATALAARIRDQTCTFPTCDTRASDCQLDHTDPHPQGRTGAGKPGDRHETSVDGLGTLCDSDHRMKTLGGWHVAHTPTGWEWTSPHDQDLHHHDGHLHGTNPRRAGSCGRHPHRPRRPRRRRTRRSSPHLSCTTSRRQRRPHRRRPRTLLNYRQQANVC